MSSKRGQKSSIGPGDMSTPATNGKGGPSSVANKNAWSRPLQSKTTRPTPAAPPGLKQIRTPQNEVLGNSSGRSIGHSSNRGSGSSGGGEKSMQGLQMSLRERFLSLSMSMAGQKVIVTQTDNTVLEGIFHSFAPFGSSLPSETRNKYVIKSCKIIKSVAPVSGMTDDGTVIIPSEKVSYITVKSMPLDVISGSTNNGSLSNSMGATHKLRKAGGPGESSSGSMFRTDKEISGPKGGTGRDLVAADSAWTAGSTASSRADALLGSLDDSSRGTRQGKGYTAGSGSGGASTAGLRGNIGKWDQFKANEELFNVSGSYDENLYTTELDKSTIDSRKIAEAGRIAREIETTTSSNIHISEERGHIVGGDYDEEDRYSGVLKDTSVKTAFKKKEKVGEKESSSDKNTKELSDDLLSSSKSKARSKSKDQLLSTKTTKAPTTKMNYAAAAAKADVTGKKSAAPPGFLSKSSEKNAKNIKESNRTSPEEKAGASDTKIVKGNDTTTKEDSQLLEQEQGAGKEVQEKVKPLQQEENNKNAPQETGSIPGDLPKSQAKNEKEIVKATDTIPAKKMEKERKDKAKENGNAQIPNKDEESKETERKKKQQSSDASATKSSSKLSLPSSKLNANAKSFSFNPTAKSFTPFAPSSAPISEVGGTSQEGQYVDPNIGMAIQTPPFIHGAPTITQPGMVPIINPQFSGVRYAAPYPAMDQHNLTQVPAHQPQHVQMHVSSSSATEKTNSSATHSAGAAVAGAGDEGVNQQHEGEASSSSQAPVQQQIQQGQQQIQVTVPAYTVPPHGAYYGTSMGMHPRGPAGPHHPSYAHAQFVGNPQQITVNQGGAPYRHMAYPMQQGGMPPNMQVRAAPSGPYYPSPAVGPMQGYPQGSYVTHGGMMEEESGFRGAGGGGRGSGGRGMSGGRRGRGGGGGRRQGGRGSRGYSYHPHGGNNNNNNNNTNRQQQNNNVMTTSRSAGASSHNSNTGAAEGAIVKDVKQQLSAPQSSSAVAQAPRKQ